MRKFRAHSRSLPTSSDFSVLLSHDVDNLYEREWFRILGDLNHLRRIWTIGEKGRSLPCIKRLARYALRPRNPLQSIESILSIESRHGFRSTFFFLEDMVFNRYGGRYRYKDDAVRHAASRIRADGGEIGVHGAYHAFNSVQKYSKQRESFSSAFGVEPEGIRNHFLRHSGEETWRAQEEAGFTYDASFGYRDRIGIRDGKTHPFFPLKGSSFVAIPLHLMDSTIFRKMGLGKQEALKQCKEVAREVIDAGGVLSLNWHNNYFEEEEFQEWQEVYEELIAWLAEKKPWNATGAEIADWWRKNHYKEDAS